MTGRSSRIATRGSRPVEPAGIPLLTVEVRTEWDVVAARQRARQLAGLLGYDAAHQTRLATAVSEIARNAYNYAGGGKVDYSIEGQTVPQLLAIVVSDSGGGIPDLERILDGRYRSPTGMGLGIVGAKRLMDQFQIVSPPGGGTIVTMRKLLPRKTELVTRQSLPALLDALARIRPGSATEELQQQNRELLAMLEELNNRKEDLIRLNHELEDTNRGVVALYAELDEKADHLRRADEMKSKFLSNMSHEFRTPLNSIVALSRLLMERAEGELTSGQERQVYFIRKSAESLYELVNDLLDLAKVEAGKTTVHPAEFDVKNLFGALRGMLRPLLLNTSINLVFEEPEDLPPLMTDEGKVSQILRNFISNALKFTERGEVRVSARREGNNIVFSVADTGIGIQESDQERIFQEFAQVESPIQHRVKGTGLGLPLSRKLAELLGGSVRVVSQLGVGSTFVASIPIVFAERSTTESTELAVIDDDRIPVLVLEDHYETRLIYESYLKNSDYQLVPARTVAEARNILGRIRPGAVVLDLLLNAEDSWDFLAELKNGEATKDIPVLVVTTVDDPHKVYGLGAEIWAMKPISREWLLNTLRQYTRSDKERRRILIVDDDEISRYLVKQLFTGTDHHFLEAADGSEGLLTARTSKPDVIFLDLMMPGMGGFEMLEKVRADSGLRDVPVVVVTSRLVLPAERKRLAELGAVVISKEEFSSVEILAGLRRVLDEVGLPDLLASSAT